MVILEKRYFMIIGGVPRRINDPCRFSSVLWRFLIIAIVYNDYIEIVLAMGKLF